MRKKRKKYETLHRTDHRLDLSPAGRNLFVTREKALQQRQVQRIRGWMRLVLLLALGAAGVAAAAVGLTYLGPWFRSEITLEESSASSVAVVAAPEIPAYDAQGLAVYDDSVTLFTVNRQTPADEGYAPQTETVSGVEVDVRMAPALAQLCEAAKADGLALTFSEGYVPYQEQQRRFDALVARLMQEKKLSAVMARTEASAQLSLPGQSDFQSGFCVRLAADAKTFDASRTYSWLKANLGKFGFIFRYPQYKEESTGVAYDPTVIRWVGSANAAAMQQRGLCLEEYIDYLASQ